MEGRLAKTSPILLPIDTSTRDLVSFLPNETEEKIVGRVGDDQGSEPPRPNKPSTEDNANKCCHARSQMSLANLLPQSSFSSKLLMLFSTSIVYVDVP